MTFVVCNFNLRNLILLLISSLNDELRTRGLKTPNLEVLRNDIAHYDALLFQPSGDITYSDSFVGNSDTANVKSKYAKFLEIAKKRNAHLAITPEYSCPWDVLIALVNDEKKLPNAGSVWILGCESMNKDGLRNLPNLGHLEWIYDESIMNSPGKFVDPVCILFKTSDMDDTEKWVGVIQFKTHEMGGDSEYGERNNLIKGKIIYQLGNETSSTKLIVLICSDAFNAKKDEVKLKMIADPTLLIHIQLNQNPRHVLFSEYRRSLFGFDQNQLEILCLNWAHETKINKSAKSMAETNSWGTALYTKSSRLKLDEKRIGLNHSLGLYTTYWKENYAMAYYCYSSEAILQMRNTVVSQSGMPGPTAARTGPEMSGVYIWNESEWHNKDSFGNNWILDAFESYSLDISIFENKDFIDVLNIERFIALSTGQVERSDWYSVEGLALFQSDSKEVIKRISCDLDQSEEAIKHRNDYLNQVSDLKKGIEDKSFDFPERIRTLKGNAVLTYDYNKFKNANLYSKSNKKDTATIAYIGKWPEGHIYPQKKYDEILKSLSGFEIPRLVVYFKVLDKIKVISFTRKPLINEAPLDSPTSIIEVRHAEVS